MIAFKVMNLNTLVSEAEDLVDDRLILVDKIPMIGEPQIEDVSHQKQVTGISAACQSAEKRYEKTSAWVPRQRDMYIGYEIAALHTDKPSSCQTVMTDRTSPEFSLGRLVHADDGPVQEKREFSTAQHLSWAASPSNHRPTMEPEHRISTSLPLNVSDASVTSGPEKN